MEVPVTITLNILFALMLFVSESFPKKLENVKIIVERQSEDCSQKAADGDQVSVHYTGYLESGAIFDSSVQQKREPISFILGKHQVIPGWEEGLQGMCVGEKRKLVIPPHLAYGPKGYPPAIPPDATLTFETELVGIQKQPSDFNLQKILQFISMPALVLYIAYYLYSKYKQEAASNKTPIKGDKSKGKKRK